MTIRVSHRHTGRQGVAMLFVLVVFAVLGVMLTESARHAVGCRKFLEMRCNRQQATWLARAGAEWAANRLLADGAKYQGETVELTPGGRVQISIDKVGPDEKEYRIRCAVRYPVDGLRPVNLETTRQARRITEAGTTRIDLGAPE